MGNAFTSFSNAALNLKNYLIVNINKVLDINSLQIQSSDKL